MQSTLKSCITNSHNRSQRYEASRCRHAPGHLRDALIDALDASFTPWNRFPWWQFVTGGRVKARWLLGQLWNCRDVVPSEICDALDRPSGRTFAQIVRQLKSEMPSRSFPKT